MYTIDTYSFNAETLIVILIVFLSSILMCYVGIPTREYIESDIEKAILNKESNPDAFSKAMKKLVQEKQVEKSITNNSETPLHVAARSGQIEALACILEMGAKVSSVDKNGNTPLHVGRGTNIIESLINQGSNINATNNKKETPWIRAILDGRLQEAQVLEPKTNRDIRDKKGYTGAYYLHELELKNK
jgi:ankyrin repeat protein